MGSSCNTCQPSVCNRSIEAVCETCAVSLCYPCLAYHMTIATAHNISLSLPDNYFSAFRLTHLRYSTADKRTLLFLATKSYRKFAMKIQECANDLELNKKQEEATLMRSISHARICRCVKSMIHSGSSGRRIFIVMEYCERDLEEEIIRRLVYKKPWTEEEMLKHMRELVEGLAYMQRRGLAHRDVKPANVLIAEDGLKLADFGLCLEIEESATTVTSVCVGTVNYLSPELKNVYLLMIEGKSKGIMTYNPYISDVFSLGLTVLHMASLLSPSLNSGDGLQSRIEKAVSKIKYSDRFKELLMTMLQVDEQKRCDFLQLKAITDSQTERKEILRNNHFSDFRSAFTTGRSLAPSSRSTVCSSTFVTNKSKTLERVTRNQNKPLPQSSPSEFSSLLAHSGPALSLSTYSPLTPFKCAHISLVLNSMNISVLNLENSQLDSQGLKYLSQAFAYLADLSDLNLSSNSIEAKGALELANAFPAMQRLKVLRLWDCGLSDEGVMWLFQPKHPGLAEVYLGKNEITQNSCKYIGQALNNLQILSLIDNSIGDGGALLLAEGLRTSKMQRLFLDNNKLTCAGGETLLQALPSSMIKLRLNKNFLTHEFTEKVFQAKKQNIVKF